MRTSRIASVAYAFEDRGSEAKIASPAALPRRSWRDCAVGNGVPTKSRFRLYKYTEPMIRRARSERLVLPIARGQVLEPRVLRQERHLELAGGTVALLADVHLGRLARLFLHRVLAVERRPVQEHDDVRVLFEGARFTKIAEPRRVVAPRLDRARELRERDDGDVQLLGQRLERARDLGDLLLAVVEVGPAAHELQVVDHDEVQAVLGLHAPR